MWLFFARARHFLIMPRSREHRAAAAVKWETGTHVAIVARPRGFLRAFSGILI